ncbi:MAG: hypothetical protein AAGF92_08735 [Myxococcota bacterium]
MISLGAAAILVAGSIAHQASAQTNGAPDLSVSRVFLGTATTREELQLEYESIRVGPPAGGLVVSTIGILGGVALSFAGAFRDFCLCDDPLSGTAKGMIAGGTVISMVSFGGFVASGVFLATRAKRRRAIRARLRDGALVW